MNVLNNIIKTTFLPKFISLMPLFPFTGILSLPSSLNLQGTRNQTDFGKCKGRRSMCLDPEVSMVKNVEQSLLATCVGSLAELGTTSLQFPKHTWSFHADTIERE